MLKGSNNQKVIEYKLHETSVYGKLECIKREGLEIIIDWLIANGFILQRNSKYPVLHLTYNGIHYQETIKNMQLKSLARVLKESDLDCNFSTKDDSTKIEKTLPISAGLRWTDEEDKQLLAECQSGSKISAIAKEHNRSYGAIKAKIEKLTGGS